MKIIGLFFQLQIV